MHGLARGETGYRRKIGGCSTPHSAVPICTALRRSLSHQSLGVVAGRPGDAAPGGTLAGRGADHTPGGHYGTAVSDAARDGCRGVGEGERGGRSPGEWGRRRNGWEP